MTDIIKPHISLEDIKRVENHFIEVCKRDRVKWGSKKFYDYQSTYFCGAMTAWNIALVKWKVLMTIDRPIVEKYTL